MAPPTTKDKLKTSTEAIKKQEEFEQAKNFANDTLAALNNIELPPHSTSRTHFEMVVDQTKEAATE
jgi:hypothetical protein